MFNIPRISFALKEKCTTESVHPFSVAFTKFVLTTTNGLELNTKLRMVHSLYLSLSKYPNKTESISNCVFSLRPIIEVSLLTLLRVVWPSHYLYCQEAVGVDRGSLVAEQQWRQCFTGWWEAETITDPAQPAGRQGHKADTVDIPTRDGWTLNQILS